MDNQWQLSKCGSTCQSSAEPAVVVAPSPVSQAQPHDSSRNSMMSASHYYYPNIVQEPCSSTRKMMADPLFQHSNTNLYNSSLSAIGTSFFTLLSGPPASISKYDSQQLLSSKPPNPSSKVHIYNSGSIVSPTECEPSFGSPKLSSHKIDKRYLKPKIDACPVSDGGNTSCLRDIVQARKVGDASLELAKSAIYHTSRGIKQVNDYSSLKTVPTFGATPVKAHQLSPIASGLPRVFCLYASGDLFFSSSGLLGVVCSCHGFRMSISKFSEHSGLQDVNPGDVVHVDSGETIAQWRKVYFGKFGIRMSEDQHGWHWPQGFSAAPDLVKKSERVPNVSRTSDLSKSAGPPRPLNKMVFPDKHHSSQNLVNEIICHEVQRNTHDKRELPKGFTETSQSNAHGGATNKIIEQLVSGCLSKSKFAGGLDNTFQSNPTLDSIYKTKNSFTSQNSLQNIRSLGKDSDKFNNSRDVDTPVKAIVSSNIELRLGQPSQQSNAPGFHTPHVSRVGHPFELVSSQPKLYNAGSNRIIEERKQVVDCAAQAAKSSLTEGQNRLNFSNLGFGAYSTRMTLQPEKEATRVMNPHTPLSRQSLKYSNQDDISSSCGFGKNQIVPGNSLNENLRSSMTLPSKLTGRDGYKLASKYNLHGTTSWTAGGADKSAVISSFQIRDTGVHSNHLYNPDQTGPSLPRIGRNENNGSSSGHGNCCQGTPCAYVPDKCSCWVQRNTMTENSNLQGKNSVSAFGEPSQIRTSILSASKLDPSAKIGETMKPNLKKVEISAFQWKDVPSKMSGRCHVPCKDQKTKFLEDPIEVNDQTSGVADQPVQKADYMKEQVMSNISSKCSTPALTQASVKISNGDSCTDDAHNTGCAKNFAVDEGSGIQKSSSSDDALDSGGNTGFDGSACKINFKNGTRSLIDELRVIDSLRMKKVHNQVHTGLPMYEKTSSMKTFEKDVEAGKRKRETKFKILGTPFPASPVSSLSTGSSGQSSQSLEDVHRSTEELLCKKRKGIYDDCLEIHEGKKTRLDFDFSKRKPCKRIIRPVVCGRYGLISNGDTSKPAKIFSLGKILKTSKRCDPPRNKVIKKSPAKVLKKSIIREGNRRSGRISSFKENKYHVGEETTVVSDEDPVETSKDSDTSYVLKKGRESGNERNHGIPDSNLGTRIRRKTKEVRKRSIYELITKGKDSTFATISKDIVSVPRDNLNHGNSNNLHGVDNMCRFREELTYKSTPDMNTFCHVCGSLTNDDMNCLLECNRCLVKVHQACYGISKFPKSDWCCRPCREDATDMVCVLCGYEGGVMTRAVHSTNIVRTLLNAWNVITESQKDPIVPPMVLNSVTAGFFDSTIKQWVHMVCGLWTPGTRCPNVDTMSTFDVSGACHPEGNVVCSMCKRAGGCCIRCRVMDCAIHFHPWCAHQKGLLQSEIEGADNENVGFYGRCELHATEHHFKHKNNSRSIQVVSLDEKETCARTEGYKGRKREGFRHDSKQNPSGSSGCVVRQEQVDAWNHINQQLSFKKRIQRTTQPVQDVEADPRKEYARYKQSKGWKQLVVYKSGIHALGLYTSMFISQSEMVVEYVGEIVGLRVADRRESEYQSGKQLQYKSACYFFRIDKEHIIDATRKGGIARFVNHSCQPNCVAKVITVRGEKKVVFFAERDIYPGEEITYDYHFNNEDEAKKILCSCDSNNCRRYLN